MRYFEMFAGIGGFSIGIEKASKENKCVGFSEIDKYASMVLAYRYPGVKNYGDCTRIDWRSVPDFDLLVGGSPCQSFSIAGKRKGLAGASGLVWEYLRCLGEKQPRYFIWENVKGALSSRRGLDYANILSAFSEQGYSLWWQVLNAKDIGVAQNRERVFIVGSRNGSPREVFFEREGCKNLVSSQGKGAEKGERVWSRDYTGSLRTAGLRFKRRPIRTPRLHIMDNHTPRIRPINAKGIFALDVLLVARHKL